MARNKNTKPNRMKRTLNPDGEYVDRINPETEQAKRHRRYDEMIKQALASSNGDDINDAEAFDPLDMPENLVEDNHGVRYDVPYVDPSNYNTLQSLLENYFLRMNRFLKWTDPTHRFRGRQVTEANIKRADPRYRAKGDNRIVPTVRQSVLVIAKPPIESTGKTKLTKNFILSHITDERGFANKLDTRDFSLENLASPIPNGPARDMTHMEKAYDQRAIKRTESCGLINFPHGTLEPDETPARAAQRHMQFQTGLCLENISCIGAILPSKQEAREILVPYVTYIITGHARSMNYGYPPDTYPSRSIRPYYCSARDLNAMFGVTPYPIIAALVNYQHGQFAMEMESFSGPYTTRLHCYRVYSHPLQLHRMEFGKYPGNTGQSPPPELSSGKLPDEPTQPPPENPQSDIDNTWQI